MTHENGKGEFLYTYCAVSSPHDC